MKIIMKMKMPYILKQQIKSENKGILEAKHFRKKALLNYETDNNSFYTYTIPP